jgi:hypothetical protein
MNNDLHGSIRRVPLCCLPMDRRELRNCYGWICRLPPRGAQVVPGRTAPTGGAFQTGRANHNLNRKDFSLCTPFQHFPPTLITCTQSVMAREGYFRAANFLESIFSEIFMCGLNALVGMDSDVPETRVQNPCRLMQSSAGVASRLPLIERVNLKGGASVHITAIAAVTLEITSDWLERTSSLAGMSGHCVCQVPRKPNLA